MESTKLVKASMFVEKDKRIQRLVLRGGRNFLLTRKKGQECLNFLLAIAQVVAGLHVEVKHKAFYPIAVGAFGTDSSFPALLRRGRTDSA